MLLTSPDIILPQLASETVSEPDHTVQISLDIILSKLRSHSTHNRQCKRRIHNHKIHSRQWKHQTHQTHQSQALQCWHIELSPTVCNQSRQSAQEGTCSKPAESSFTVILIRHHSSKSASLATTRFDRTPSSCQHQHPTPNKSARPSTRNPAPSTPPTPNSAKQPPYTDASCGARTSRKKSSIRVTRSSWKRRSKRCGSGRRRFGWQERLC